MPEIEKSKSNIKKASEKPSVKQVSDSIIERDKSKSSRNSKQGPGRPRVDRDTHTQILDAAEQLFSKNGYVLTATREIAQQADVRQSMISYYFQSKQALFEAVFKRRAMQLSEARQRHLDELLERTDSKPTVAEVIQAYLAPQFALKQSGAGGLAFVRIQSRLHNEPEELAFKLRRDVYDQCTKRYISVLEKLLPEVDPADVNWRMVFLVGTYLYMLAGVDRLEDLSDGRFNTTNSDELVARMSNFLAFGFQAPSTF
ncbi:transcriptional regulator PsrA [Comamonas humi]